MSEIKTRIVHILMVADHDFESCDKIARRILEAIREPTKEMIYEGNSKIDECIDFWNYDSGSGYSVEPHAAHHTWQTMIDEALK